MSFVPPAFVPERLATGAVGSHTPPDSFEPESGLDGEGELAPGGGPPGKSAPPGPPGRITTWAATEYDQQSSARQSRIGVAVVGLRFPPVQPEGEVACPITR